MTTETFKKTVYVCPYCEKILGNAGQAIWHLKSKHLYWFNKGETDLSTWKKDIEVHDINDQILVLKDERSTSHPVKVHCHHCGEIIAYLDYFITPDRFRFLYGSDYCFHCGAKLNSRFNVKQS